MSSTPTHIGRYPVKRLIGSGAMGTVYLAHDTELDRLVAIKTVHPRLVAHADSADILERLRNEARAVARVRHPSIVEVYDVGKDAHAGPFLVFEYVEGTDLKRLLRDRGPLEPDLVVALARQIGDALTRAHASGIIHRDIKPENLLVGTDGRTRLLDFGVARLPDAVLTGEGQFLGTPAYSAPETLSGGNYSPKSDQFSLAAVLFEAVTGARAFSGDEAIAVAHSVIHDPAPLPSERAPRGTQVPERVDHVLLKGLAKHEKDRFEDVQSLVEELEAAYEGREPRRSNAVADTLPRMPMRLPQVQPETPRSGHLKTWLISAGLALVAGSVIMLRFVPSVADGSDASVDGGVGRADAGRDATEAVPALGNDADAGGDAADAAQADATPAPADADAPLDAADVLDATVDAGAPIPLSTLTPFEREERAKDALDRARAALDQRNLDAADAALGEASLYDPEHPDIPVLRRRLDALR